MPITVEIEPEELITREADSRGRITLGSEFAGETVKLLTVSDPDRDNDDEGLTENRS